MKELLRTRRLTIAVLIFVILLLAGFLTLRTPAFDYTLTPQESLEDLTNSDNTVSLSHAIELSKTENQAVVFIDIRDPFDFAARHIENAVNIPVPDILDADNIAFLKNLQNDSTKIILYGNSQQEANGPWMLLHQIGFQKIKILACGCQSFMNYSNVKTDTASTVNPSVEQPLLNFAEFIEKLSPNGLEKNQQHQNAKPIIPVKRAKKSTAEGGC